MNFEKRLHLEQLNGGADARDLLIDLRTAGAGAKVTAAAILLHISTLHVRSKRWFSSIDGISSICKGFNKNNRRAKASSPTYSQILISRNFSRNQRGIAANLIWVDRHALLDLVWKLGGQFVANIDDVRPQFNTDQNVYLSQSAIFQSTLVRGAAGQPSTGASVTALNGTLNTPMTAVDGMKQLAKPWYSDQILPFDITLAGASELGAATAMKIFGVEILNEGSGVSIVAEVTMMQATFVARTRCFATEMKFLFSRGRGSGEEWSIAQCLGLGFRCSDRAEECAVCCLWQGGAAMEWVRWCW
jgi:hypothetical protein